MSEIYDRIKARRIELGLTVEQLAALMGYKDKSSISKIENGKADIPQSKVAAFARALKTTTAYLVGIDEVIGKANKLYDKQMSTGKVVKFCCNFKTLEEVTDK